jgi:uncharacterized membrane protein YgcG
VSIGFAGSACSLRWIAITLVTCSATVSVVLLSATHALAAGQASTTPRKGAPRAPGGPVLSSGGLLIGGEASASAPSSGGDPLAGNGLDSPLCRDPRGLSTAQRRSCETDSFVAAPDPTNDYAFDVNINTGISRWGNDMSATIDNFAQFGWMALVSATHGLVVMFEWCYSLNLLSGSFLGEVTAALRNARLTFTEPWLVIVLAVASTLVVYHGLVRRQVAETMGQALAMLAMMVGGLWVIADPAGTVGVVEQWTNQAGLGTMAAVASGTPGHAERTLADSMQVIFSSVITTPWCYLEFGDVGWCDNTDQLSGELKQVGLKIAKSEEAKSGCHGGCGAGAGPGARTLFASAALLREAQTNGELFLALPANEPGRNSVTKKSTLLNVLCGGGKSADECSGPTAPQAEFRSQKGTGSRAIGLFAIWLGALGMLLLLGYLALRLLGAALVGLFFLLLAPAAVLAPALGDGGRSAFRGWALKLMEAVIAKLTYSFLLGVVLMMMKLLLSLTILGWWEQWLLISAFWWGVFLKRHQTLGWAQGPGREQAPRRHRSMARRVEEALDTPRALLHTLNTARGKRKPAPEVKPRPKSGRKPPTSFPPGPDRQSPGDGGDGGRGNGGGGKDGRGKGGGGNGGERKGGGGSEGGAEGRGGGACPTPRERERAPARGPDGWPKDGALWDGDLGAGQARLPAGPAGSGAQGGQSAQLGRVRRERQIALANGDTRRAAKLGAREQRIEGERARRGALAVAMLDPELELGEVASMATVVRHRGGEGPQIGSTVTGHPVNHLAVGHSQVVRPPPAAPRGAAEPGLVGGGGPTPEPGSRGALPAAGAPQAGGRGEARQPARQRSSVMDDAREVAARRKRQLGWGPESAESWRER